MDLLLVLSVASAAWGFLNLLTVLVGGWNRPGLLRTVYLLGALVAGWAALGAVGLDGGWVSLWAGLGALNQLSAVLVHAALCLRSRR